MNANDEALLNDLLDGRLDEDARRDLEVRLASEADLAALWVELQQVQTLLRRPDPARAPAAFLAGVHRRLAGDDGGSLEERRARALLATPRHAERGRWRLMALPLSAAAVLLIGLVVADRLGSRASAPVRMARHGDEISRDGKSGDDRNAGAAKRESERQDAPAKAASEAASVRGTTAESRLDRAQSRGSPRPPIPGLAGGGGNRIPRLQPGGVVPAGLRRPSDEVRPDAFAPPSGEGASAPAAPIVVYALTTESIQNGTRSLASLLDEQLEAGLDGTWRVVPPPTTAPKAAARPMAASASASALQLIPLDPTELDPTAVEVAGRRVFDSMTLVLSPEHARRLGSFARDKAPAPSEAPAVDPASRPTHPPAPDEEAEDGVAATGRTRRARGAAADEGAEVDRAEADRAEAKKEVRVRIWLVR